MHSVKPLVQDWLLDLLNCTKWNCTILKDFWVSAKRWLAPNQFRYRKIRHNRDIAPIRAIFWVVYWRLYYMYTSFWNTLTHALKALKSIIMLCLRHFQNESYIPQLFTRSSHRENPSVLMGWWSGIGMVVSERSIHILKSTKLLGKYPQLGLYYDCAKNQAIDFWYKLLS